MTSDFERRRLGNIERNAEFLSSMGFGETKRQKHRAGDDNNAARTAARKSSKPNRKGNHFGTVQIDESTCRRSSRFQVAAKLRVNFTGKDEKVERLQRRILDDTVLEKLYHANYDNLSPSIPNRKRITKQSLKDYIATKEETVSDEAIAHCVMRIYSMSEKALANRIKMIARAAGKSSREKLLVSYYAMEHMELEELAKLAKSAL